MIINLVLDTLAQAAPTAIKNDWTAAANILDNAFSDNITVNIKVTYTGTGGGAAAKPDNGLYEPYTTVRTDLLTLANPGDTSFNALPNTSTIAGSSFVAVWNPELKALGILNANDTTTDDGSSTFATDISASLMTGVALHEFAHALGRVPFADNNTPVRPDVFDLFRFSSPGNIFIDGTAPTKNHTSAYFSLNGGLTASKWADYGVFNDPSDFLNAYQATGGNGTDAASPLTPEDAFNQFYDGATVQYLTPVDLEQMDVLGFHPKSDTPAANPYDFVGNGSGDVLLQNSGGLIKYASMFNGVFQNEVTVGNTPGFSVVGQGKIVGNGSSDVVIQDGNGTIDYAILANGNFSNWGAVAQTPGFNVVGVGDINDHHYADIVVENFTTGEIDYADMTGGVFQKWVGIPLQFRTPGFNVVGVGDVNGDGFADIVIQNFGTGEIDYANMNGGVFNGWQRVAITPGWTARGVGDINRDGFADVVIQNNTTGHIAYANMFNGVLTSTPATPNGYGDLGTTPNFNVVAVEDVVGNGFPDIVVENFATGEIDYGNTTPGTTQANYWQPVEHASGFGVVTTPVPTGHSTVASVSAASLGLSDSNSPVLTPNYFGTVA